MAPRLSQLPAARWLLAALLSSVLANSALAQGPTGPGIGPAHQPGFVSGPGPGDPVQRVRDFVRANRALLRLEASDLDDWITTDATPSAHTGITHVYLRQRLAGIEVDGGDLHANVLPDGSVFGVSNRFVPHLTAVANTRAPGLSAEQAVSAAAGALGLSLAAPLSTLATVGGPTRETLLSGGGISVDPIPVFLVYHSDGEGGARLAWNLFIRPLGQPHWWNLNIDAVTGALLHKTDWILNDSYRVFPLPVENPDGGPHSPEADPADATATPYGWHDTNGTSGGEFSDTRGNNVNAQEDADANNSGGFRPVGSFVPPASANLAFDFLLDLHEPPGTSQSAAITNLFYWNNVLHDIHYQYGFDEASGNYQVNNYGKGGTGGDPVFADALDGTSTNNANFSRAPEGSSPRMQMFRFEHTGVTIHAPASLRQMIRGGTAEFGAVLTPTGVTGDVVRALDTPDAPDFLTTDGCSTLTNGAQVSGKIALIDRGGCTFVEKVANAQAAGATAALIVNNAGDDALLMGGTDATITIPSILIGQTHGAAIAVALGSGVNVTLSSLIQRDGDFDNGIIIHEYGHGVSIRLSGGPSNANCLGLAQSAGMGEGWGDFWALALTAKASDLGADARPLGSYAQGEGPSGPGIRNFPYSTDLLVNPQTFATVRSTNQPHGVGEIWAQALWEMYWNLVGAYGFDSDLYSGSGGNNLALQLVMDALKIQGCDPTFLAARDAILMADVVANGGANQCLISQAFAKRGMGEFAADTGNPRRLLVTEDFTIPAGCEPGCGNGALDAGEQCDDGGTQAGDCCSATCQIESAAVECRASTGTCDPAELCTGSSAACPADAVAIVTTECRPAASTCDVPELCDGLTAACPADAVATVTTECRPAANTCDVSELCDGVTAACPVDAVAIVTTECRAAAGACDAAETCDGVTAACPADAKGAGECRPATGNCDVAEFCDGSNDDCPADAVDVGLCGAGDTCNGVACVAKNCQFAPLPDDTDCSDANLCNGDETCLSGTCTVGTPLVCEDSDICTEDSCDAELGCVNDPILTCQNPPVPVPTFPGGGAALRIALPGAALLLSGVAAVRRRRRLSA